MLPAAARPYRGNVSAGSSDTGNAASPAGNTADPAGNTAAGNFNEE